MIPDFSFILLQLLLILFWRQIERLESGAQAGVVQILSSDDISTRVDVATVLIHVEAADVLLTNFVVDTFIFHLHEDFDRGLDVV